MMPKKVQRREGERIGPWKLVELLGKGGNGEVWKAIDDGGTNVAVKILYSRNPDSEPYRRFKAEVKLLQGARPGVLPLIAADLPERPSPQAPAWLAMPVATGIREALGAESSLEMVVEAIANIAETLASLHSEGISHRDVKPENLYGHEGKWMIGDFGLVSFPDKEAITEPGRKLGPLHYMAPEMLTHPETAKGPPADVYSLAKSLWVLATGQTYPPPGEQRVDVPQLTISANVVHLRSRLLDRLIERATRHDPADRPTMAEVTNELRAWLSPPITLPSPEDLSDLDLRIATVTEPTYRTDLDRNKQIDLATAAFQRLKDAISQLTHKILKIPQIKWNPGKEAMLKRFPALEGFGGASVIWSEDHCSIAQSPGTYPVRMLIGAGAGLFSDGELYIVAAYVVEQEGYSPNWWVWHDEKEVQVGSAAEERAIHDLMAGLNSNLRTAVERFTVLLESARVD